MTYRSFPSLLVVAIAAASCGGPNAKAKTANQATPTASAANAGPELAPALTLSDLPVQMAAPVAGTFTQEIDHPLTAAPSIGTFQQRYWYSTEFASGPNAPVIFNFCGEAPCDPWYVQNFGDSAKALGAAVVTLEHRYYGPSQPFATEKLADMKYLTIRNALEDAAAFQRWAMANLPLKGKWIAAGGSYSGMLAAYYRLMHPELVVGAWASSSPVNVELSFTGYDANVAQTLGPTCALLFNQALAAAATAYKDPTQCPNLSTQLYGDPSYCEWDETDFLGNISGFADEAAQYGYEAGLCSALEQEELTPLQGIVLYLNPPLASGGDSNAAAQPAALAPTPGFGFPHLQRPTLDDFAGSEWWYQVCTEVGFYQIANPDRNHSVTPDRINEAYYNNWCQQLVGGAPNVAATSATYYAPLLAAQASNILFVTGSADPWSVLSFMDPSAVPAGDAGVNVQGGSHCQDYYNLTPNSLLGVFQAHKLFHDLALTWIDEAQ